MSERKKFKCKSEEQKRAIKSYYAKNGKREHVEAPYPHFRYYKKSGHPALIVAEHSEDEYKYRKVMHGETEGGRKNEIVYPNPNPKDPEPMYIAKRKRHDKKTKFEDKPLPWQYPKK